MKKHLDDIQEPSDLSGMEAFGTETRSRVSDLFRRTRMPVVAVAVLTPPSVLGAKIRCRDYIERPKPGDRQTRCTKASGASVRMHRVLRLCQMDIHFTLSTWMYPRSESVSLFRLGRLGHPPGS